MTDLQTELAALIADAYDVYWSTEDSYRYGWEAFIAERLASAFQQDGWLEPIHKEYRRGPTVYGRPYEPVYRFARPAHSEETQQ